MLEAFRDRVVFAAGSGKKKAGEFLEYAATDIRDSS